MIKVAIAGASGYTGVELIRSGEAPGGSLVCCPQARLRTFPGNDILGTRGDAICCWIEIGGQKRGIQVALYRPDATGALVPALRERLGDELPASMAK